MKNYEITIGYRAVITVNVKAANESEAKEIALEKFKEQKNKTFNNKIILQDDIFNADGCVDMDATWNMCYK